MNAQEQETRPVVWVCPDARCSGVAVTDRDDCVRVTCTRREPHLADREFPEMVRLDPALSDRLRGGIEDAIGRLEAGAPQWEVASRLRTLLDGNPGGGVGSGGEG